MPALYPSAVAPEDFKVGDRVKKLLSDRKSTAYVGVVSEIHPGIHKVDVQWPMGNVRESPEDLVPVNPSFFIPSAKRETGYSSYDKSVSQKIFGQMPKRATDIDKMPIRIAHNFASNIMGSLIGDVSNLQKQGYSDLQTYNRLYKKYGSSCSDHILRYAIQRVYTNLEKNGEI